MRYLFAMATHKGMAGKTLVGKSLRLLFFGSDKAYNTALKGMEGERRLGKELRKLPDGWRVWHDLDIGNENIDHVVASAKGVFVIEVKNYTGSVLATSKGLYTHRSKTPNTKVTQQVWRQVYALHDLLGGQFVKPLLVFLGEVKGDGAVPCVKGIPCLTLGELVPYLRAQKNVLEYAKAKELFATLDSLTK